MTYKTLCICDSCGKKKEYDNELPKGWVTTYDHISNGESEGNLFCSTICTINYYKEKLAESQFEE